MAKKTNTGIVLLGAIGLYWWLTRGAKASKPKLKSRRQRVVDNPYKLGASKRPRHAQDADFSQVNRQRGAGPSSAYGRRIPPPIPVAGKVVFRDRRVNRILVRTPVEWGIVDAVTGARFRVDERGLHMLTPVQWNDGGIGPWAVPIHRTRYRGRPDHDPWYPLDGTPPDADLPYPWIARSADSAQVRGYGSHVRRLGFAQDAGGVSAPAVLTGPPIQLSGGTFQTATNFRWLHMPGDSLIYVGQLGSTRYNAATGNRSPGNRLRGCYLLDAATGNRYSLDVRPDRYGGGEPLPVGQGIDWNRAPYNAPSTLPLRPSAFMADDWPTARARVPLPEYRKAGDILRRVTYRRAARILAWVFTRSPLAIAPAKLVLYSIPDEERGQRKRLRRTASRLQGLA